jgi:hypothetical protein
MFYLEPSPSSLKGIFMICKWYVPRVFYADFYIKVHCSNAKCEFSHIWNENLVEIKHHKPGLRFTDDSETVS